MLNVILKFLNPQKLRMTMRMRMNTGVQENLCIWLQRAKLILANDIDRICTAMTK